MGSGRKSIVVQGKNKKKECRSLPMQERNFIHLGSKNPANRPIVDISEEVLNELRQMNPRNVANILVN